MYYQLYPSYTCTTHHSQHSINQIKLIAIDQNLEEYMYYHQLGTISQKVKDRLANYGNIRGSTCITHQT